MFDFYGYNKPGKGVQKRDPNQSRISLFFELFFRKLWSLCKVNMIYVLLIIPAFIVTMLVAGVVTNRLTDFIAPLFAQLVGLDAVDMSNAQFAALLAGFDLGARVLIALWFVVFLGAGPATAGVTYALRNYAREEHIWMWSDIWGHMKSNFKQAFLLWILDLAVFYVMAIAFDFYASTDALGIAALCVLLFIVILYLMMHIYVYQIMITFELKLKHVLKNSAIMSILTAPKTFLMLIISAVVHIGIPILLVALSKSGASLIIFAFLEILFLPSATAFASNFFIYNTVEKQIKIALEQVGKVGEQKAEKIEENANQEGE